MNHSFVVCDLRRGFADRLADYVNKRHLCPYLMESFTDVDMLEEYGKRHRIEVLIIDELLYTDRIKALNIGKIFLLTEERDYAAEQAEDRLYKFSPIPEILNAVMLDFADRNKKYMSTTAGKKTKVIGGFTPASNLGHTSFLLTLALKTAEKGKAFYMNISSTYGFRKMLDKMSGSDLADVMYCINNGNYEPKEWPEGTIYDYHKLKMIMPAVPMSDLQCIKEEDWVRLLEIITDMDFEYIFLELDESTSACFPLLERCDLIYSAYREDFVSISAFSEFDELLNRMGLSKVREKIRKVYIPDEIIRERPDDLATVLKNGQAGEYLTEVLREDK